MFANTQALGMDVGFPDNVLQPASSHVASESAAGDGFHLPGLGMLGGLAGSLLPQINPAVAGGLIPSLPKLGGMLSGLPLGFLPHIDPSVAGGPLSAFQHDHGVNATGGLSDRTADSLKSAHGS